MTGPVVELRVWGVRRPLPALLRMAAGRRHLGGEGTRFARLLGTGSGRTFSPRDADPHHWALLTVFDDEAAADRGPSPRLLGPWESAATEELRLRLRPLRSRGRWGGVEPFSDPAKDERASGGAGPTPVPEEPARDERASRGAPFALRDALVPRAPQGAGGSASHGAGGGPVAALTRARLRPTAARSFRRAVPAVVDALAASDGARLAIGIGEAPVLLQGTFSLWESETHLEDFAHRSAAHRDAVRRTRPERWYAEELFARFAVDRIDGTYRGTRP